MVVLALLLGFAAADAQTCTKMLACDIPIMMTEGTAAVMTANEPPISNEATGNWGGMRDRLAQTGISLRGSIVLEGFNNFMGGIRSGEVVGASTIDLSIGLDAGRLVGIAGGKLYADLEDHAGQDPSNAIAGDLQVFDKLNSPPYLQLFEFWYQQLLFDGTFRLKVGKIDANSEFSVIDYGLPFLSSSTQVSPTVFLFPTTPDPMPAVNLFLNPTQSFYASVGAFYSNTSDNFGDFSGGPEYNQLSKYGGFFIFETGYSWLKSFILPFAGNLKLGAWGHDGTFQRMDNTFQTGTGGVYAIIDQTIWAHNSHRKLRSFLEYGLTQQTINPIYEHFGAGLTWAGPISSRPADIAGLTSQYAAISPEASVPNNFELAVEAFYALRAFRWGSIMPDFQYIVHPGGVYRNALVATVHLSVRL